MLDKSLQLLQEINFQHNKSCYLEYKLFQVYWKIIFPSVVYTHHDLVKTTVSLFKVLRVKTSNFLPSANKNHHHHHQNPQTLLSQEKVLCPAAGALQIYMTCIIFLIS